MIFSFHWDNVYLPDKDGKEMLCMNILIDQVHTKEKIRYILPIHVIDEMTKRDYTPNNEDWWTLRLDLKLILT